MINLCAPAPDLTCFRCCPPIRPVHYDPLDFMGSLRREFRDNRERYLRDGPRYRPIVGYTCWALGFLDAKGRRIGCLLHPLQNGGRDLRSLINYGTKCERESCVPSKMFAQLPEDGKRFWLPLVQHLDAFSFSSSRTNPLFHLMLWGPRILEPLRVQSDSRGWTVQELLSHQPFLMDDPWNPLGHRYLFRLILESVSFRQKPNGQLENLCRELLAQLLSLPEAQPTPDSNQEKDYTHRLPLERDFTDLLRLGLGWEKTSLQHASDLEHKLEKMAGDVIQRGPRSYGR